MENQKQQNKPQNLNLQKTFTQEEDKKLSVVVNLYKNNLDFISEEMKLNTSTQYCNNYNKLSNIKGPWSEQEDKLLMEWIQKNGPRNWTKCSEFISGRSGKQCREHWNNSLNPNLVKGNWTSEEDFLIMFFYKKYNGSWKKIINLFEGRTENSIKNRFFSQLRKIAGISMSSKRQFSSKIGLQTLLNYYEKATSIAKNNYLIEKPQNEEDLNKYLNLLEQKIINAKKEGRNEKKENSDLDNSESTSINENINKENKLNKKRKRSNSENKEITDIPEISKETTNDLNQSNEEENLNNQNKEFFSIKNELQKKYTINKDNIPSDCEEEELLVPSNNNNENIKKSYSFNNSFINPFSLNMWQNEKQEEQNYAPFLNFCPEQKEISSFKIDGDNVPFNFFNQYSMIDDNNNEFSEFYLKTKPSTGSVNGCKVVDNDNELGNPFEMNNCNKNSFNWLLRNDEESIMRSKGF